MAPDSWETICAVSTGAGRSALAIVRISGPNSFQVLRSCLADQKFPEVRSASLRKIYSGRGDLIDEAVVTIFAGPNSFTGEDLVELSVHGNPIICDGLIDELVSRGTRRAKPGEFSLRACLNGRMSLHELEALDLMLNGQTEEAVRAGVRAKLGGFSETAGQIRERLLQLSAQVEADLDFGESESGSFSADQLVISVREIRTQIEGWLNSYERAQSYLKRLTIALVGRPNVGKSSLFNALLGEGRALVHEDPGTTRDYLEVELRLDGRYALLYDTAGIRSAESSVERLGIEKTREALRRADVIVWVSDVEEPPISEIEDAIKGKRLVLVKSKADLADASKSGAFLSVSALKSEGLEALKEALMGPKGSGVLELSPIVSAREEQILKRAVVVAKSVEGRLEAGEFLELTAEGLRELGGCLEEILGKLPHEELLRNILARFCIGK